MDQLQKHFAGLNPEHSHPPFANVFNVSCPTDEVPGAQRSRNHMLTVPGQDCEAGSPRPNYVQCYTGISKVLLQSVDGPSPIWRAVQGSSHDPYTWQCYLSSAA